VADPGVRVGDFGVASPSRYGGTYTFSDFQKLGLIRLPFLLDSFFIHFHLLRNNCICVCNILRGSVLTAHARNPQSS
jgi:hypothetical protein